MRHSLRARLRLVRWKFDRWRCPHDHWETRTWLINENGACVRRLTVCRKCGHRISYLFPPAVDQVALRRAQALPDGTIVELYRR